MNKTADTFDMTMKAYCKTKRGSEEEKLSREKVFECAARENTAEIWHRTFSITKPGSEERELCRTQMKECAEREGKALSWWHVYKTGEGRKKQQCQEKMCACAEQEDTTNAWTIAYFNTKKTDEKRKTYYENALACAEKENTAKAWGYVSNILINKRSQQLRQTKKILERHEEEGAIEEWIEAYHATKEINDKIKLCRTNAIACAEKEDTGEAWKYAYWTTEKGSCEQSKCIQKMEQFSFSFL